MILKSRQQYTSSEDFKDQFLATLTPGVISRENFIKWDSIFNKTKQHKPLFEFFKQQTSNNKEDFIIKLSDALMSSDVSIDKIHTAFELLGHTGKNYVSDQDYLDFKKFAEIEKDEHEMYYISKLLVDLGLLNILNLETEDYFIGVQVGLETHRRKNIGGAAFSNIIQNELNNLVGRLALKGYRVKLEPEEVVVLNSNKQTKTVDYCISFKNIKVGIEVNFYTASGSKPTEIKRSYGHINSELEKQNIVLVWITDGVGYKDMTRSLKEARDIHPNTYNLNMMKDNLEKDLIDLFESSN